LDELAEDFKNGVDNFVDWFFGDNYGPSGYYNPYNDWFGN
jgi:hypothetical protein